MESTYINLGCGNKHKDGYINIDIQEPADVICRIGIEKLPFADGSIDGAEADNFLEHLTFDEFVFAMNDVWRVLKPRARFHIRVPDAVANPVAAFGDPSHKLFFTTKTFDYFTPCGTYRVNGAGYGFNLWVKTKHLSQDGKYIEATIRPVKGESVYGGFSKYRDKGDYHWSLYKQDPKYKRHVDRVVTMLRGHDLILDIGAGDGLIASKLAEDGHEVMGIDNEPHGVDLARKHGVDVILGDGSHMPYIEDDAFDAVFIGDVIEHMERPEEMIHESVRVAKHIVLITTPPRGMQHDKFHVKEWLEDELKEWIESLGYQVLDIITVPEDKEIYATIKP